MSYLKNCQIILDPDRVLQCRDGIALEVHSQLLSWRSKVFANALTSEGHIQIKFNSDAMSYVFEDIYETSHAIAFEKHSFAQRCEIVEFAYFYEIDKFKLTYAALIKHHFERNTNVCISDFCSLHHESIVAANLDECIAYWIRKNEGDVLNEQYLARDFLTYLDRCTSHKSRKAWINLMLSRRMLDEEITRVIDKINDWQDIHNSVLRASIRSSQTKPNKRIRIL